MTPTDPIQFFDERSEVSRRKIDVYVKYLRPLAYKLLHGFERLWIIDGYAGAGIYGDHGEGSPLAAAKQAAIFNIQQSEKGKRGRMNLINVEAEPEIYRRLDHALVPYRNIVTNLPGRFQDRLDQILSIIGTDPALFFIDPFGVGGADIRVMEEIIKRRGDSVTEMLIHFSHTGFKRMAGNLDATGPTDAASKSASETKVRKLSEIIGSEFWKGAWRNPNLTTDEKVDEAAKLYEAQLRERGVRYVHNILMRKAYDEPTSYRLVFATQSAHGVYVMGGIVAMYERKLFEERYEGTFDIQLAENKRAEERVSLRKEIHEYGLSRPEPTTPVGVYMHFAPIYFEKWLQSDYDKCLRALVEEGGIDRFDSKGIQPKEQLRFVPIPQEELLDNAQ